MTVHCGEHSHEVNLVDDGTLDTVISIDGVEHRFSQERGAECRDESGVMTDKGLRSLATEILYDECEREEK